MTDPNDLIRALEVYELGEWDWWYAPPYNVLHAATVEYDPLYDVSGDGITACGWKTHLAIPGIISRMYNRRCSHCCRKLGFPQGNGSPKNDPVCRPLVEQRLAEYRNKLATSGSPSSDSDQPHASGASPLLDHQSQP